METWTKVTGPASAILCEMKDLGITVLSWQVFRVSDDRMISMEGTCPEDVKQTPMRHA